MSTRALSCLSLCAIGVGISTTSFAQDVPDPNPVPNADGTFTYYSGFDVQFTPSQAIAASGSGDEIVIMGGASAGTPNVYVQSLDINTPDLTIRANTNPGSPLGGAVAGWGFVTLRNPTQGPESGNSCAVRVGSNTQNTMIGRPAEYTQLANGRLSMTQVPVVADPTTQEWSPDAVMTFMVANTGPSWFPGGGDPNHTQQLVMNQAALDSAGNPIMNSGAPGVETRLQAGFGGDAAAIDPSTGVATINTLAFRIESRSIDKVAILSEGSMATFHSIEITTQNGFGGGIMITGSNDSSAYVDCKISGTMTAGQDLEGNPVHAVTIVDGNPHFAGCSIGGNVGAERGVIVQTGGSGSWAGCFFGVDEANFTAANDSPVSDGIYSILQGSTPQFFSCTFSGNTSRFGTVYFDSTQNGDNDTVLFSNCAFIENATADTQWGATAYCVDAQAGRSPLIVLDRCVYRSTRNNSGTTQGDTFTEHDVVSNYFPRFRVLRDCTTFDLEPGIPGTAGVDNAASGDEGSPVSADLNGDGVVNGADLAIVLGAWN